MLEDIVISARDALAIGASIYLSAFLFGIIALLIGSAIAWLIREADAFTKDDLLIINVSGRGDKDVQTVEKCLRA